MYKYLISQGEETRRGEAEETRRGETEETRRGEAEETRRGEEDEGVQMVSPYQILDTIIRLSHI